VRLFDRTTRSVGLTEAGRLYLDHCLECLQAVDDADASVSALSQEPKGHLRVTAPVDLGNQMAPIAAQFMNAHPALTVELQLSNRPVDLVEEGVDLAIRVAPALDGRYVARPLALTQVGVYAAPAYLQKHGHPRQPKDLEQHRGLVFLEPRPRDEWTLERDGNSVRVKLKSAMTSNYGAALIIAAAEGAGLAISPSFVTYEQVRAGALQRVLPEWTVLPALTVYAVYPHRRFLAAKIRAFVETLRTELGGEGHDPWWSESAPSRLRAKSRAPRA
jgi:DNA-binding transcriptional LysR family regulator